MKFSLHIPLDTSPEQTLRLQALQRAFAEVCNALAPRVQQTRTWNRVALHHMAYKQLRTQFPEIGSQMVCNAIYSVSRSCRLIYQHPQSPFHHTRFVDRPLPLLRFTESCPVYFDRHTLSLKNGQLSMYTLDGRMKFQLHLKAEDEARFHQEKLREIVLVTTAPQKYQLSFLFSEPDAPSAEETTHESPGNVPEYVMVEEPT